MPTYDYRCQSCGHEFELFQQMSEPVKRKCPDCGRPRLERLIGTGAGVIFKGGGFYQTDYRSEGYKKAADADTKASESKAGDAAKPSDAAGDNKAKADASPSAEAPSSEGARAASTKSARSENSPPAARRRKRAKG